jgi:hypothetical protein
MWVRIQQFGWLSPAELGDYLVEFYVEKTYTIQALLQQQHLSL